MSNHQVIKVIYPVIIELNHLSIQKQLQQFIFTQLIELNRLEGSIFSSVKHPISFFRLPKIDFITYRCAIAFQLSRHSSVSPINLAEGFFNSIQSQPIHHINGSYLNFTLKLFDSGWLEFTLCDRSLALWLQSWQNFSYPHHNSPSKSKNPDNLWPMEYTYSRCCSLLRLGEQEKLIKLKNSDFKPDKASWSILTLIPWDYLEFNQIERSLISQIITTVDRLVNESNVNKIKLGLMLSESFLNFERYCRIFGEISRLNLQLSQARLGLVGITHYLLQGLWLSQMRQPLRNRL